MLDQSDLPGPAGNRSAVRALWLKHLHQWHWISSALCLLGMLLFSITGITLNHATEIEATPHVTRQSAQLPAPLQSALRQLAAQRDGARAALPDTALRWLAATWSLDAGGRIGEWSTDEIYVPLPKAGGDAWVRIGLDDGATEYELTERGTISWLNDVHKGRNTGAAWNWLMDLFAVACLVFCMTGLLILKFHAANRPFIWPVVGLGVLLPCLIALLFIH